MYTKNKICFFTTVSYSKIQFENYTLQDIKILKELGYDVIIANNFFDIPKDCEFYFSWWASGSFIPLIISKLLGRPIITIAGGNEATLYKDSTYGIPAGYLNYSIWKKVAVRLTLKYSTKIIVVSNFMVKDVLKLGSVSPVVIHNCVDTTIFYNKKIYNKKYITTIFNLDKNTVRLKRGEIYIKSIAKVVQEFPDQIFLIIGKKGNDLLRIENLLIDLNIKENVILAGTIPNTEIINILNESLLYVQISDTETFGLSIAEAMSCEVPVLVSRCGAIPEVVGEYGIYVNHNSVKCVSKGIVKFLSTDLLERENIGKNLRKRILNNFTYQQRKLKIKNLIEKIK